MGAEEIVVKGGSIRLVIVDDQQPVRERIEVLLRTTGDITLVGGFGDATAGVVGVRALRPDVVLLDVRMPGVDGVEAAYQIASDPRLSKTRIVMLSSPGEERRVFEALKGAAAGFVPKALLGSVLVEAIRCVVRGSVLPTPAATGALITSMLADLPLDVSMRAAVASLTDQERDVVRCVAAGLPNRRIAMILGCDSTTMFAYLQHVRAKLAVRERMQLAVVAYATGLIRNPNAEPVTADRGPVVGCSVSGAPGCRPPDDRVWPDRNLNTSRWGVTPTERAALLFNDDQD